MPDGCNQLQRKRRKNRQNKDAEWIAAKKAMQELKSKEPSITLIQLTPEQFHAAMNPLDPVNEAWVDQVSLIVERGGWYGRHYKND
jgi:hypothetical protein